MAERKSILLRLQPETYAALQRWAADEFRSLNGQIEFVLDHALKQAGRAARRRADASGAAPEAPPPPDDEREEPR
jgi:hypothetical protein